MKQHDWTRISKPGIIAALLFLNDGAKYKSNPSKNIYLPVVWLKYIFYILRPETTKHQSHCVTRGVFCDQGPLLSGQGKVSCSGLKLQPVQPVCLRWIGLQSLLHQEVLHAVCEQTLGPVSPSDSG